MEISKINIDKYFISIYEKLLDINNRKSIKLNLEFSKTFPDNGGVYCIFENDVLIYVGETGSLYGRVNDLRNTKNHTLRRTVGEKYFSNYIDFKKATSQKSFSEEIEKDLVIWMENNLKISTLEIAIGRKEFEEWVQENNPDIIFFNKRTKRKKKKKK